MKNYGKSKLDKVVCETGSGSESQLRMGKVLAPHGARHKTVPLIEWVKQVCFWKCLFFTK